MQARGVYTRTQDPKQSTEFTYCRFFVPYLNNDKGACRSTVLTLPRAPSPCVPTMPPTAT